MLRHLSIRDFAVVRETELEFGPGLTVISGETGAGKSLLVDALAFLSGQRADSGMVRHGADRAELTAGFDLLDAPDATQWLRDEEFDGEEGCQLRRTLRADGGSRAWINGRPATLTQLSELAGLLVEIHGQHEHQALLSRRAQLDMLDAFGGHAAQLREVAAAAAHWEALLQERERLTHAGAVDERMALLQHELDELERETLDPPAIAELVATHRRQAHSAALLATATDAIARIDGDDAPAIARALRQLRNELSKASEYEPRMGEADALLEAASIQLDEALALLERVRDDLDMDPSQYDALDRRLERLHDLARKHRLGLDGLSAHRDAIARELDALRNAGARLAALDGEIEAASAQWREACRALSAARATAAELLAQRTTALLQELGMGGGRFEAMLEPIPAERPDPLGAERVELLVSANAGQPTRPLRKVASGGELSRISLAIEVAALGHDRIPTMVFDEVDSGIGGAVAEIVGRKLRALGAQRQALCVTHLPQVAAQGHAHYRVSKAERSGVTQSAVEVLDADARAEELARMLGGVLVSAEARAAARRLLAGAA